MSQVNTATATSLTADTPRGSIGKGIYQRIIRYGVTPLVLIVVLFANYLWVSNTKLDSIEQRTLNTDYIVAATIQQLVLAFLSSVIILLIAIPLGIMLSRPKFKRFSPIFLGVANIGQAFPAIGILVIATLVMGVGLPVALFCFVLYGILPVLRNTIVGLEQISPQLIEAAKGIGMNPRQVLTKVELPLAVPVLLAGVRTTLVLTVGVATLATFVNAGGLGDIIVNGLKLNRVIVQITGAVLTMAIALFVDWLARIAEDVFRPKGLT